MTELTLQDIVNAENSVRRVRVILDAIGRVIYKMREGTELGPEYVFEHYARVDFSRTYYGEHESPDWGEGVPIFSLKYYWPGGEMTAAVTFPRAWLEQDWRSLERERLATERQAEDARARKEAEDAAREREREERRTYERLRAKFEGGAKEEGVSRD